MDEKTESCMFVLHDSSSAKRDISVVGGLNKTFPYLREHPGVPEGRGGEREGGRREMPKTVVR